SSASRGLRTCCRRIGKKSKIAACSTRVVGANFCPPECDSSSRELAFFFSTFPAVSLQSPPGFSSFRATLHQEVKNKSALDPWFASVYEQLPTLARQRLSNERQDHTLQPTALVNEVFLRLQRDGSLGSVDESRFFIAAAEAMRRILIEHARAKG